MSITKKQVKAYMADRHPEARFMKAIDSWVKPGSGWGLTQAEAAAEALAEIEMAEQGIAQMPAWARGD